MTEQTQGILFTDGKDSVLFHPPEAYSDGHGFHHQVDIVSGPFRGTVTASSYEGLLALSAFHKQLKVLYERLRGEANLPTSYENITMSVKGDGLGHLAVSGEVAAGFNMEVRLRFSFRIDQTQLPEIIDAIDRLFLAK